MEQGITNIITKLENNPRFCVSVYDAAGAKIIMNYTAAKLQSGYGGCAAFFDKLKEAGHTEILIEERKVHGNSAIVTSGKRPYVLHAGIPQITTPPVQTEIIATPLPVTTPAQPQGLAAGFGMGLGFPEVVGLHVAKHENIRFEEENKYLKETNERLKKEIDEIKEERLKSRYDEAKAKGNTEMLTGLLAHLPQLMAAFKGQSAPAGLAAPQGDMSEAKQTFLAYILSPEVTDEMLDRMYLSVNSQEVEG